MLSVFCSIDGLETVSKTLKGSRNIQGLAPKREILSVYVADWFFYAEKEQGLNKTARIRAKPWMFRLPFKFYGAAVIT